MHPPWTLASGEAAAALALLLSTAPLSAAAASGAGSVSFAAWELVLLALLVFLFGFMFCRLARPRKLRLSTLVHDRLLGLVADVGRAGTAGAAREELEAIFSRGLRRLFKAREAGVHLLDRSGAHLEPAAKLELAARVMAALRRAGVNLPEGSRTRILLHGSRWYARALASEHPIVTSSFQDVVELAREFEGAERVAAALPALLRAQGLASMMSCPLRSGGETLGVVDVGRVKPFSSEDAERFEFACNEFAAVWSRLGAVEKLDRSEALYRALTEVTPDLVFVVDADRRLIVTNMSAVGFAGRSSSELSGSPLGALFGPSVPPFEERASEVASSGEPVTFVERIEREGVSLWLQTTMVPLTEVGPGFVLGVSRDISVLKQNEDLLRQNAAEAEERAARDTLTGLHNRTAFEVELEKAIARVHRQTPSAMLFMDLDGFKRLNDERGHAFGDEVLRKVAAVVTSETREVDTTARIGGDEFCALLDGTDALAGTRVAQRIRVRVRDLGENLGMPLDVSIGVSNVTPGGSARSVMMAADRSMYEEKQRHRDQRGGHE